VLTLFSDITKGDAFLKLSVLLLPIFVCARLLSAQSPSQTSLLGEDPISAASREMEFFTRSVRQGREQEASQTVATRAQEAARLEFQDKADKFVTLWGDFATRLNHQQVFDAKLAKKLSKAFHDLETSSGWPVRADSVEK
jgi:hypothetical protein